MQNKKGTFKYVQNKKMNEAEIGLCPMPAVY